MDVELPTITNERYIMSALFTPVLASGVWIGGGSVGFVLLIIVVALAMACCRLPTYGGGLPPTDSERSTDFFSLPTPGNHLRQGCCRHRPFDMFTPAWAL